MNRLKMHCSRALPLTLVAWAMLVPPALAAERPAADPVAAVTASSQRVQAIVAAATDQPSMVARIRAEMTTLVDYRAFAQRALKKGWPALSTEQQDRFVASFERLLMNTYAKRFKPGVAFRLEVRGSTRLGDGDPATATVLTTLHGDKAAADVDYLFAALPDAGCKLAWRCVDITIDEASLALGWRKRFQKVLDKDGFEALIEKIDANAKKAAE